MSPPANRGVPRSGCPISIALEMLGDAWSLLIVRDLLVGPRRFSDLRRGLPKIPTNILSTRLKELEQAGVVQRRVLPPDLIAPAVASKPRMKDTGPLAVPPTLIG